MARQPISIDFQIDQARQIKKLTADNSRLRQRIIDLEKQFGINQKPKQEKIDLK